MGSRSGGRLRGDANPNGDRTDDRFLSLNRFFIFALFFTPGVFFDLLDHLETDDVYRRKADLEIPVGKLYDMVNIN